MANVIRKAVFVILIVLGALGGYWLARENQKFFEMPYRQERPGQAEQRKFDGTKNLAIGMDTWQVKEALGPPEKRTMITNSEKAKEEEWTYGSKRLFFTNGFLSGWKD